MILSALRRLLGIRSPSRVFSRDWTRVPLDGDPVIIPVHFWYDARSNQDPPWPSPEMRRAARLERRRQRRASPIVGSFPGWTELDRIHGRCSR